MQEVRCNKCGKLLFKIYLAPDIIKLALETFGPQVKEIPPSGILALEHAAKYQAKCPRCKELNTNNI